MVYHGLSMVKPWFNHGQSWTLNGTSLIMVNHGQNSLEKDMIDTWSTMYDHGQRTCLVMVYHGRTLKSETMV